MCVAIVVPGMGADMRLGDVMKAENADFGISFVAVVAPAQLQPKQNTAIQKDIVCAQLVKA